MTAKQDAVLRSYIWVCALLMSASFAGVGCGPGFQTTQIDNSSKFSLDMNEKPGGLAQPQYILLHQDMAGLSDEVGKQGGVSIRQLEISSGVIAQLPLPALSALKKRFPDLTIVEDKQMKLINPIVDSSSFSASAVKTSVQPAQMIPWGNQGHQRRQSACSQ